MENKDSGNVEMTDIADLQEGVHAAFYNSKGNRIAISTTKGRIFLLDSALNILKIQKVQEGRANSSFFSLDDSSIISGGQDKKLTVLDALTLEILKRYDFGFNSYTSVYGYNTLGGCGEGGKLVIYDLKGNDTIVEVLEAAGAYHLYYIRPDTSLVVSSGLSGYEYNIPDRKISHAYKGHRDIVYCIMPSHDEKKIITASRDSMIRVFDRYSERELFVSNRLDGAVYVACFNTADNEVAASTSEGYIYFLDTTLAEIRLKIKAFNTRINTIHYSPSGNMILAGSEGGGVKIFAVRDGKLLYSLSDFSLE